MKTMIATVMLISAAPVVAQVESPSVIRVVGNGTVKTAPDIAVVAYGLRGEGATSDDAVRALVSKRGAIEAALAGKAEVRTGRLSVTAARDKACDADDRRYDEESQLSTGACAVKGYVAYLAFTARIHPIDQAGTLLGLIGRLGAIDPSLRQFAITNPGPAHARAIAAAVEDARIQAQAIASASAIRLGRLRRVEDQRAADDDDAEEVIVTGSRVAAAPPPPPPITVALSPEPIETSATLTVEFEVAGPTP